MVIDPADADRVVEQLEKDGLVLDAIITTHGHMDHSGGNAALCARYSGVEVLRISACIDHYMSHFFPLYIYKSGENVDYIVIAGL